MELVYLKIIKEKIKYIFFKRLAYGVQNIGSKIRKDLARVPVMP